MTTLAAILRDKSAFRGRLGRWYVRNRRDLPWRATRDPYRIWVSEIMLQQTRVKAVLGHYRRFLERFPTICELAAASEADVLAAWSGLGYYRRARMMRQAAQEVVARDGGVFPATADELQNLPGIGRYTAAAIASIAYNEPRAVVDGNVERVVERLAGRALPPAKIWGFMEEAIGRHRPGDFNQAMMELGAMVCTPRDPDCRACPVRSFCKSQGKRASHRSMPVRRTVVLRYGFARRGKRVLLVQRNGKSRLMAGMWELPGAPEGAPAVLKLRHSITTTDYQVYVHSVTHGAGRWVPLDEVSALPLTGLARKVLTRLGAIASPA